ncbi:MAG: hypothetical protein ACRBF0_11795 [Calditrichia bacterium]
MTPFHPKFRQLLLADKDHQKAGLTPSLLHEFECLGVKLSYILNYPPNNAQIEVYLLTNDGYNNISYVLQGNNDWGILSDVLGGVIDQPFRGALSYLSHIETQLLQWNDIEGARIFKDHRALILQETSVSSHPVALGDGPTLEELRSEITFFRNNFLVNYDTVHQHWVGIQKRSANKRYLSTSTGLNLFGFFISLFLTFFPRREQEIRVQYPSGEAK